MSRDIDESMAQARAAVDRETSGFVYHQYPIVLVKHPGLEPFQFAGTGACPHLIDPAHRWQADTVSGLEPGIGAGALAIDPDLPGSDKPVYRWTRKTAEVPAQEIVETPSRLGGYHFDMAYLGALGLPGNIVDRRIDGSVLFEGIAQPACALV